MRYLNSSTVKRSISLALVSVFMLLTLSSCGKAKEVVSYSVSNLSETAPQYTEQSNHISHRDSLIFIGKSGLLELYFDKDSYGIAVEDTGTKKIWYALPNDDHATDDCDAFVLEAKVSKDGKTTVLNSQDNSVAFNSASYKTTEEGIAITYDLALDEETAQMSFDSLPADALYVSVCVNFVLKDGAFFAKINCADIKINGDYILESISLLNFFGATDSAESGDFLFVPDGNGAVLMLSGEGSSEHDEMKFRVYGDNPATVTNDDSKYASSLFACFGVKRRDNAFLGIVLGGDRICDITALRKGEKSDYNRVGASFRVCDVSKTNGSYSKGAQFSSEINICYRFLSNKNASYFGLATAYREMLMRENILSSEMLAPSEHIPFMLTVRGAAAKGYAYSYEKLSTYEQTLDLLEMLKGKSVNSITLNYADMLKGANTQSDLSKAKPISSLGSKKDFEKLSQYIKTQKFSMFLDVSLVSANRESDLAGINRALSVDGAYMDTHRHGKLAHITKNNTVFCTSLLNLDSRVVKFLNNVGDYSFDGYCVNDAGKLLYSDYSRSSVGRTKAANIISSEISVLSNNHKIMVDTGNFYSLKYADYVINLPRNTYYPEQDGYIQIPFAEFVLHGLVNYSLEPINLAADTDKAFLQSVEYGAMPSYDWVCTALEDEEANAQYYYDTQLAAAADNYLKADKVLGSLADARLTNNYIVQSGVRASEYDNSVLIYFNYNDEAVTVNSIRIEPMSFVRVN